METENEHLIEDEWNLYRLHVIPAHAPEVQIVESRNAFFAGAGAFLRAIAAKLDPSDEVTAKDEQVMESVRRELLAFAIEMLPNGRRPRAAKS